MSGGVDTTTLTWRGGSGDDFSPSLYGGCEFSGLSRKEQVVLMRLLKVSLPADVLPFEAPASRVLLLCLRLACRK